MNIHKLKNAALAAALAVTLAGCGSGGAIPSSQLSGSAGDGPLNGATITVYDATGAVVSHLGDKVTGAGGAYSVTVPADTAAPVVIKFSGGTDIVSGAAPEFDLETTAATLTASTDQTANANPLSTLAVQTARALAGTSTNAFTATQLATSITNLKSNLGFGLDSAIDPISTKITSSNVASALKAYEAIGEMIRRTAKAQGTGTTTAQIMQALAEDLTDNVVDGKAAASVTNASAKLAQIATVSQIQSAAVGLEVAANNLQITNATTGAVVQTGANSFTKLNSAVGAAVPLATATIDTVPVTTEFKAQLIANTKVAQAQDPTNTVWATILSTIGSFTPNVVPSAATITQLKADSASATSAFATISGTASTATTATLQSKLALTAATNSFKLSVNSATGTDVGTTKTLTGTTSGDVFTVAATSFDGANIDNLVKGVSGATSPSLAVTLSTLATNTATNAVSGTIMVKDGTTSTRTSGQRQIAIAIPLTWTSDGTTFSVNAVAGGSATVTYTNASNVAGTATVTNVAANTFTSTGKTISASIGNVLSNPTLATIFNNGVGVRNGSFFYSINLGGMPVRDANGVAISTVQGTFTTN